MRKFAMALVAVVVAAVGPVHTAFAQSGSVQLDCSSALAQVRAAGSDVDLIKEAILANEACVGEMMKIVARKGTDVVVEIFGAVLEAMSPEAAQAAAAAISDVAPARTIVAALGLARAANVDNRVIEAVNELVLPAPSTGTSTTSVSGSPS